ncbi:MAG: helix-turn-helix domain-containing protein [Clostridiales Family XIII bacterium]|nr:helix-turn-helix domain-containing protein [Clostridiales Family XIII bacterium]
MVNIHEYFSIDWESTSDNLRELIGGVISEKLLADAMCVSKRTIYNWCNNKARPGIDELLLLSKFFNIEISHILVTKGQLCEPITEVDYNESRQLVEAARKKQSVSTDQLLTGKYEIIYEEEFISHVIFNEYVSSTYPIKHVDEFLLSLPLFPIDQLCDLLCRVEFNWGYANRNYFMEKLKYSYDRIDNPAAKKFIEYYREYYLTYPYVETISELAKLDIKRTKCDRYEKDIMENNNFLQCHDAYKKAYEKFIKKLKFLDYVYNFKEQCEKDSDIDYA